MSPVQKDVYRKPFTEGVDNRGTDAVQSTGIGIVFIVKFSAGMQYSKYDLHARNTHCRMCIDRHTTPVVINGSGTVLMQRNLHFAGKSVRRLINGIVDNLPK